MSLLFELTLRGSAAALLVAIADRALAGRVCAPSRRLWWCLVPVAFLVPLHIPVLHALGYLPRVGAVGNDLRGESPEGAPASGLAQVSGRALGFWVWLAGALGYAALVAVQTVRASRRWSSEPLSADRRLVGLLETCKADAGVTAPVGLVVSGVDSSPAILGSFRPRILLPESLASAPLEELRPVFLHELAHFRSWDVPFNWLLTLVRAVHWFNPLAHFGALSWARFREEAADEAAMGWMRDEPAGTYGHALIRSLRGRRAAAPFGSLSVVESISHLKRRIYMINHRKDRSPRAFVTGLVALLLAAVVGSISARADGTASDPRAAAVAVSRMWLKQIDEGQFQRAFDQSGAWFHQVTKPEEWIPSMAGRSAKLGKCTRRAETHEVRLESDPPGSEFSGDWAYVAFRSSYEKASDKAELVVLKKEGDGEWKVAGYSIGDPKP